MRNQSEDLFFVLFSEEDEPPLSDEADVAAALDEPLVPLLADSAAGLLSDFSLVPSVALALPARA